MWLEKDVQQIVYLDKEIRLKYPPGIYADNEDLPFKTGSFDVIYFDPPHGDWGESSRHTDPKELRYEDGPNTFFGWWRSRKGFFHYLDSSQEEFYRVLRDDGLLLFKWNETEISLNRVLIPFNHRWRILIKTPIRSIYQRSKHVTYWIHLVKRLGSAPSKMNPYIKDKVIRAIVS